MVHLLQGSSTCDSLSDSGISDGDSDGAGRRARRLSALRELARRLQAALAPNSPAQRAIAKVGVKFLAYVYKYTSRRRNSRSNSTFKYKSSN